MESLPEAPLVLGSNPQHSDFSVVEELHRSSGGTVYLARHRPSGRKVVLKERRVSELGRDHELDNEVELYERVPRHPNLIAYLGSYRRGAAAGRREGQRSDGQILVMVFEYAPQGDLHRALLKQRSSGRYLGETMLLQWFLPIAAGVRHLHKHGVVHRDLKSLNIVLCDGVPKICDLGISRFRSDETVFMRSFCGTPAYLSPEMVATQPYTEKTDVWALGELPIERRLMVAICFVSLIAFDCLSDGRSEGRTIGLPHQVCCRTSSRRSDCPSSASLSSTSPS